MPKASARPSFPRVFREPFEIWVGYVESEQTVGMQNVPNPVEKPSEIFSVVQMEQTVEGTDDQKKWLRRGNGQHTKIRLHKRDARRQTGTIVGHAFSTPCKHVCRTINSDHVVAVPSEWEQQPTRSTGEFEDGLIPFGKHVFGEPAVPRDVVASATVIVIVQRCIKIELSRATAEVIGQGVFIGRVGQCGHARLVLRLHRRKRGKLDEPKKPGHRRRVRILGLDVGSKTIGVAWTDELGVCAHAKMTISRRGTKKDTEQIVALCREHHISQVVVGLPVDCDGEEGRRAQRVRVLGNALGGAGLSIQYQDESFSTVEAETVLLSADLSRAKRKKVVDRLAAAVILQAWLDMQKPAQIEEDSL